MPAPATFSLSFTSDTALTGPLWMPILTLTAGFSLSAREISSAHCTGASGLVKNTSAIPSPVGKRISFPFASALRTCSVSRAILFSCWDKSLCSSTSNFEYPTMSMNRTCPSSSSETEWGDSAAIGILMAFSRCSDHPEVIKFAEKKHISQGCRLTHRRRQLWLPHTFQRDVGGTRSVVSANAEIWRGYAASCAQESGRDGARPSAVVDLLPQNA